MSAAGAGTTAPVMVTFEDRDLRARPQIALVNPPRRTDDRDRDALRVDIRAVMEERPDPPFVIIEHDMRGGRTAQSSAIVFDHTWRR